MEKKPSWDGTLSAKEFEVSAKAFADKWKTCTYLPTWTWKPFTRLPYTLSNEEGGYLTLEGVYHHVSKEESCSTDTYEEVEDVATLVQNYDMETHAYDFHMIYSASFKVPVLYFRGYNMDGQPLGWDSMKTDIPQSSIKLLDEFRWTYITQEEHPYLNQPWFTLHPCGTSDWMRLMFSNDTVTSLGGREACIRKYLFSWLSMVGQTVGLRVPLELFAMQH